MYVDVGGCWGLQGGVGCQIGISSYFQSRQKLKPDGKGNLTDGKNAQRADTRVNRGL